MVQLYVVDVNLIFILGHFLLLHILIDVVGSRLIRNLLELGDLSAVVILNLELTCQLIFKNIVLILFVRY